MPYSWPSPIHESGNLSLDNSSTAQQVFIIPWSDLSSAMNDVLNPYFFAIHDLWPGLIVKSASYEPAGDYDANNFKNAKVTLSFGIPEGGENNSEESPGEIGQVSLQVSGESISLPKKNFTHSGGTPLDENNPQPHKTIPQTALTITVKHVTSLNIDVIDSLIGKTNSDPFTLENKTYAANQLLFLGASTQHNFTTDGLKEFEVVYQMQAHTQTWNHVWSATASDWVELDQALFESGDFSSLF